MSCNAMGGPGNSFQWERNGIIVATGDILTFVDINASYGGNYTCVVSNVAGGDSATATFYVTPYIVTQLDEGISAVNGSKVNISCDAEGFPTPTINWVDMQGTEVSSSMLLQFSPIMFGDEGIYHCVAFSEIDGINYTMIDQISLNGN